MFLRLKLEQPYFYVKKFKVVKSKILKEVFLRCSTGILHCSKTKRKNGKIDLISLQGKSDEKMPRCIFALTLHAR